MEVTYLGHAGFLVETEESIVAMDPWLSPTGAFDSAWYQFPCNHHLAAYVKTKFQNREKALYVYISHEHKDHFDAEFLKNLQSKEITLVIPKFRRTHLYDELQQMTFQSIVLCEDSETLRIPGGELTLYLDDSELDRDSAILMRSNGESFLNINDCKIHDRFPQILKSGPIDIFTAQFSGAVWHPVCYNYPKKRYEAISAKKMFSKFETIAKALTLIQPKLYLTSAGPPCFLDPVLYEKNFEKINIFPRAPKLFQYLEKRLQGENLHWNDPMPGDRFDVSTGKPVFTVTERVTDDNYADYMKAYAERFMPVFEARQKSVKTSDVKRTLDQLKRALEDKLSALELRDRIKIPLYFVLHEQPDKMIRVDFENNAVHYAATKTEKRFYSIEVYTKDIAKVLEGAITWEDFMLSFRMTLNRDPDIYHTVIHGFLVMDVDDMNWFCSKVLDVESNTERTLIEANDRQYSVQRFCPHQGADLSQGWIEKGRYLVCPRHRWKFDLENEGFCTENPACIRAFEVQ